MLIDTAIIPAAGLGTRLLPYTKGIPKEMLPIIVREGNEVLVKPVLQYIFEALYDLGIRKYYFIVGKSKRVIEDYFTPDYQYIEFLENLGKRKLASILKKFYRYIENSEIIMVNQPLPRGFGDAILRTKSFMTSNVFIVHAGDDIIYPNHMENLNNLLSHYRKYAPKIAFLYDYSDHPERYGVIIGEEENDYIIVKDVIEKPRKALSNKVIVAVYIFDIDIYSALESTKPCKGEHQLTDAIRFLLKRGEKVHALRVRGRRLDLGTPEYYLEALKIFVKENM